jgi:tetrapyrrole methylase family protein/MazG family protein
MIVIVGLGPGNPELLPAGNLQTLREAKRLVLRTAIHPMAQWLTEQGVAFESCDDIYTDTGDFQKLYENIAERVRLSEDTVYAVPGHPMFGEESVRLLAASAEVRILGAPSFVDAVLAEVGAAFSGSLQIWNAHEPDSTWLDPRSAQLVYQLDSRHAASDAKLRLLNFFPPEHPVTLVARAGCSNSRAIRITVSELDRQVYDPLTSAYCEGIQLDRPIGFYGLVEVVDRLLGPGGCPWDREQTHESLKRHMVEETYETLEAIDSGDPDLLCEELGDFLLQAVMHAQMDAIEGLYNIDDVIAGITEKLIRRHPHVFGDVSAADAEEVLKNWDAIKQAEKGDPRSILEGVPKSLPALLRAFEVSKRAARVGFEWESLTQVFEKLSEELDELHQAISSRDKNAIEDELGDLLFTLVNVARWLEIEPEDALRKMTDRFTQRFQHMEATTEKPLRELSLAEWDALWQGAKT